MPHRYPPIPGVHAPDGRYSHLAVAEGPARTLYLAGQVGLRPDGQLAAGIVAQAEQALANVMAILAAEGATVEHIVRWTWYLVGPVSDKDLAGVRAARGRVLDGRQAPPPASTLVFVAALDGPALLLELEVTAVVPT